MDFLWILAISLAAVFFARNGLSYYFKFFLYYSWIMFCGFLFIPIAALTPGDVKNLSFISRSLKLVRSHCGVKYEFKGAENISADESCVLVANHQSSLDLLGMFEHWDRFGKMTPVTKSELMFAGSFGIVCLLSGVVFIKRNTGVIAGQEINQTMMRLKNENTKLWVFPEGTRRNTGEIHKFRKGAFYAAIHAQVPIVPVVFSSYKSFLNAENKTFNDGKIIIEVLPGISTKGMTSADVDKLMEQTRSAMIKIFDTNSEKVAKEADF